MKHFSHFRSVALLKYALPLMLLMTSASAQAGDKTHHQQRTSGEAYVVHKDGAMVLDKTTNLVWQRCSVGQTLDNAKGCVGEAKTFNFNEAQQLSKEGWRVPTIRELQTLRVCSTGFNKDMKDLQDGGETVPSECNGNGSQPTINTAAFPNTLLNIDYWSSSPYVGNSNLAWLVNFSNGYVYNGSRDNDSYVRLVRASQSLGDAVALEFVTPLEKDTFIIAVKKAEAKAEEERRIAQAARASAIKKMVSEGAAPLYLKAGKAQRNGSITVNDVDFNAEFLYELIIDKFPNSEYAIKATDQLNAQQRTEKQADAVRQQADAVRDANNAASSRAACFSQVRQCEARCDDIMPNAGTRALCRRDCQQSCS
jgi:hypothetical protein